MQRTNIYLDDRQTGLLRALADARGTSMSELIRTAIDDWLRAQGARELEADEWTSRWDRFLERGRERAREEGWTLEEVEREVTRTTEEVRRERAARRR